MMEDISDDNLGWFSFDLRFAYSPPERRPSIRENGIDPNGQLRESVSLFFILSLMSVAVVGAGLARVCFPVLVFCTLCWAQKKKYAKYECCASRYL